MKSYYTMKSNPQNTFYCMMATTEVFLVLCYLAGVPTCYSLTVASILPCSYGFSWNGFQAFIPVLSLFIIFNLTQSYIAFLDFSNIPTWTKFTKQAWDAFLIRIASFSPFLTVCWRICFMRELHLAVHLGLSCNKRLPDLTAEAGLIYE